jgi:folate-binding protein YgfZ
LATHSFIASLDDLSIIQLAGEQRFDYLHGQITVATKEFTNSHATLAAHCDFKGKMFAAMVVSQFDDAFLLSMHKESAIESLTQLKKYAVFSKVDIALSESLCPVGVVGEENIEHLKVLFPALDNQSMSTLENDFGQAICFNDTSLRYLCYLSEEGKQRLLEISNTSAFLPCDLWNRLEIEAGIGNIQTATVGQFVPQMLNFQNLHAIDFNKGCYMGQEVIARTKFLGKNKRATFLLSGTVPDTCKVKAGDSLEVQMDESWRRGGVVVRSANTANNAITLLAVMPNDTTSETKVRLKDTDITLDLLPMPYKVE